MQTASSLLLFCFLGLVSSAPSTFYSLNKRASGYNAPADNGGDMLAHFPSGAAEPMNVIISGSSGEFLVRRRGENQI